MLLTADRLTGASISHKSLLPAPRSHGAPGPAFTCFAPGSRPLRGRRPPRLQAHLLQVLLQQHGALPLLLQLPL